MDVLKIPVERKSPRSQTIRVMQFAENTQFCPRPPCSLVFYARAVTAVTPRGRFNENEKLWEMPTLPISYVYFSWWQLQFTTQHSKYKRRYVKGYNSDRFAASKRDFKILVWKRFPVPERRLRLQSPRRWGRWHERASTLHTLDVERSCAGRVGGFTGRIWSRPSVPIAPSNGTYSKQSKEILRSRETESIRPGAENQDGKPRVWGKWCRGRVMWGELASVLSLPSCPSPRTNPWPEAWITKGWHASAASWCQSVGTTAESLRLSPVEVCEVLRSCLQGGRVLDLRWCNGP